MTYEERPYTITAMNENDLWLKNVKEDLKTYDLNEEMIENESKDMIKKKINKKIEELMINSIREEGTKKGKVQRYIEKCEINEEEIYKKKNYLLNLPKYEARNIFMGRSGQFPCKDNNQWDNADSLYCRWCLTRVETEHHILNKCRKCPISNRPINTSFFGQRSMADWHELSNLFMTYTNILTKRNEKR